MTNFYAHGGHVGALPQKRDALHYRSQMQHAPSHHHYSPAHLRYAAESLRKRGQGEDKVLAHISPEEAIQLAITQGADINPNTGLPQFGFWKKFKKTLPVLGGLAGGLLFPPLAFLGPLAGIGGGLAGGALGGTLGGVVKDRHHPFRGTLPGMVAGGGAHLLGSALGGLGSGGAGAGASGGGGGLLNGIGNLGSLFGNRQAPQQQQQAPQQAGFNPLTSMAQGILGNPLQSALLGTALYGTLHEGHRARQFARNQRTPEEMMREFNAASNQPVPPRRSRQKRRRVLEEADEGYDPLNRYYEDIDPESEYYAAGGYVEGDSGGQDDDKDARLKPHDFIMDATTVSLAGDGNSKAGAKRIKYQIEDKFSKGGITRDYPHSHNIKATESRDIKAKLSPGEYRIPAHIVSSIGKGDPNKGAKVLDKFRNNLRKHKGVKKFLPPKSKPLTSYMR